MKRIFRPLNREIGVVGFGTWPLGGTLVVGGRPVGRGDASDGDAVAILREAASSGVDFIDTADFYGKGRAEVVIGKAFGKRNGSPAICTKFGNRIIGDAIIQDFSPEWLAQAIDSSAKRLNVDTIDVLLLHSPPDDFDWSAFDKRPLDRLVHFGRIGCYGVSSRTAQGAMRVLEAGFGTVIEIIYNVIDRRAEEEVLPAAHDKGVAIVARCPLAYGLLNSGREEFCQGDHRAGIDTATRHWLRQAHDALLFLDELPGGFAVSAIRFCVTDSRVNVVIPGMHKRYHLEAAVKAARLGPLPAEIVEKVRSAVPEVYAGWQ